MSICWRFRSRANGSPGDHSCRAVGERRLDERARGDISYMALPDSHQPGSEQAKHSQVLIVGAGPAGRVAGMTLVRCGIPVLVVEKREAISTLPRAQVISTRSMELLRAWNLEGDVRTGAADVEPLGWITTTLASGEGTVVPSGHPTVEQA